MIISPEFAYAQARIQARFAALPAESEWRRLAASRTLTAFLEEARAGPLRAWVKGFSDQSDAHDLEAGLRFLYREILDAVAGWVPEAWREAVSWVRWLTLLALLTHLRAGGGTPAWVARDPWLRTLLDDGEGSESRVHADARVQRLLQAGDGGVSVWVDEWHRSWPPCNPATSLDLVSLEVLLMDHTKDFRRVAPASAWRLREELRKGLRLRLHRSTLQPSVPFIYLALTALDLERLRAALIGRALFADQEEALGAAVDGMPA